MATTEPTRADDTEPGPGSGPRIRLSAAASDTPSDTPNIPSARTETKTSAGTEKTSVRSDRASVRTDKTSDPAVRASVRTDNSPAPADDGTPAPADDGEPVSTPAPADGRLPRRERLLALAEPLRQRMLRHPVLSVTVLAGVLHVLWFFTFANSGGDLAAQDAWAEFVGRHPDSAYNLAWYGGMHPVSYSIVSPYLMSLLGVRTTMMMAGTVSAGLLTMILIRSRSVRNPLWASLAGLFGLLCNAISGRVTYGLGTMFALGAVAAVHCWPHRRRPKRWAKGLVAASLAALATMSSPVAGLFVGLVAVALFLQKRRPGAWALGLAPSAVVAVSAWLFPFSGTQPMGFGTVILPLLYGLVCVFVVPRKWKTVRLTAAVYSLSVVLVWLVSSQIGSNITRLAMLFAGVVLVAALPFTVRRTREWYVIVLSFVLFVGWVGVKTVDDIVHTTPAASWARELAPLVHQLQQVGAEKGRVEVVPARSHREASALAPYVNLARGWNRQADMERNPIFYDNTLNSASYHEWLQRWAVHFVVLPKGEPDGNGGERERALVQRGMPYLKQIWGDANWQLFRVTDPMPLAEPDAVVDRAEQGEMIIDVRKAGRIIIRIPYSPWLSIVDSEGRSLKPPQETEASKRRAGDGPKTYVNVNGCLMETAKDAQGDKWTELLAPRAGTYRLASPYQLPRGTPCPDELKK